jgi:replication factor C subunit 3/5
MADICNWLWTSSLEECVAKCSKMQLSQGYATTDILQQVYLATNDMELPPKARIYVYDQLARLEHRLCSGTSEALQLISLISIFIHARQLIQLVA